VLTVRQTKAKAADLPRHSSAVPLTNQTPERTKRKTMNKGTLYAQGSVDT
jgi:hypothetical protein